MSAIEACRTEALGGHVVVCGKCSHHHVAYNSCKNRHCPKCQGPAARDWMAARAEDLLPVEYFHVVFTLPEEIARIAYWNKRAVYGLLFKASAETVRLSRTCPPWFDVPFLPAWQYSYLGGCVITALTSVRWTIHSPSTLSRMARW